MEARPTLLTQPEVSRSLAGDELTSAKPLVSIVLIFLDAERFLDEAIRSVFAQTYSRWELLLVDDGSSDGSTGIARRYAERDPKRVRYLEHPGHRNLGMSASRNLGLQHANGKYIAPLDSDDVWLPEKLEHQVALLEAHLHAALLFGAPLYWFGWTGRPADRERDYVIDLKLPAGRVYDPPSLLLPFLRRTAPPPCPSDVLLRRDAVESVGGSEARFTGVYEDTALFAKLLLRYPAYVSAETWDRYRQHEGSAYAIAKATGTREGTRHAFLTWLRDYLREHGRTGGSVWRAVQEELRPFSVTGRAIERVRWLSRVLLPAGLHSWLAAKLPGRRPRRARFGSLRRLTPLSRNFGWDRGGLPIDRHYIEAFLERNAADVVGHVLEARDGAYTRRFGDARVRSDVLHPLPGNPEATIVADLMDAREIPDDTFDCIILIIRYDMDRWGDYWRFTSLSARRLFEDVFPRQDVKVEAHGNVLAATAFLYGLSSRELRPEELSHVDPDYEVLITVRAVKEAGDG
jgi:glycosyltransferase involved in cell wall biosynthesis